MYFHGFVLGPQILVQNYVYMVLVLVMVLRYESKTIF